MPNLALLALEASDGTVVLTSITLVFAMLVALCLIITLEGKIFDNINNKKNGKGAGQSISARRFFCFFCKYSVRKQERGVSRYVQLSRRYLDTCCGVPGVLYAGGLCTMRSRPDPR